MFISNLQSFYIATTEMLDRYLPKISVVLLGLAILWAFAGVAAVNILGYLGYSTVELVSLDIPGPIQAIAILWFLSSVANTLLELLESIKYYSSPK